MSARDGGAALPELPTFAERLIWLVGQRRGLLSPKQASNAGAATYTKLSTAARYAEQYSVPARWLAFGEQAAGHNFAVLGERIRAARERLQLPQRDLAQLARVSSSMVSMLEKGQTAYGAELTASIQTVERLAGPLSVRPGWLAFGGKP